MTDFTRPSRQFRPYIMGVSGGSGSGKTYFAQSLKDRLNAAFNRKVCDILFQDSYYIDQSARFDFDGGSVNFDHPTSLDFDLLNEHLKLLRQGTSIQVPNYDFVTHSRSMSTDTMPPLPVILVDGILIFHPSPLREQFDELVFFDTPEALRFERRLQRDVNERGRTESGVRSQFAKQVKPMHDEFVEPTKVFAHDVIKEVADFESSLQRHFAKLSKIVG